MILRARFVAPLDGPVIENGALAVRAERIELVGKLAEARRRASEATVIDVGDVVLLAGFVNAHTHLELSHLRGRVKPRSAAELPDTSNPPLIDWLRRLMGIAPASDDVATVEASVRDGLAASLAAGVTTIGDITRLPAVTRPILTRGPIRVVSFGEVIAIGNRRHLLEPRLAAAVDSTHRSDTLSVALSPHSAYTVEPDGLKRCAKAATERGLRVCIHVAESREEEEFTLTASGAFRSYLAGLGVWDDAVPASGQMPIELLDGCGLLTSATLLAHANYVTESDIDLLAERRAHVAYCPRTHSAFGHEPHPWLKLAARDVHVCLGTDSLASNPSLSILDELRFLHACDPSLQKDHRFLAIGSLRGAAALGLDHIIGTLTAGKLADIVSIPLETGGSADPLINILESHRQPSAVWIGGRRVA